MSGRARLRRNAGDGDGDGPDDVIKNDNYHVNVPVESLLNTHPHSQLPSYLSDAFSDLYAQDGLVVMGKGLGWLSLFSSFVRFYCDTGDFGYAATLEQESGRFKEQTSIDKVQPQRKPPLIFALNLRDNERQVLLSNLSSWGTPTENQPRIITNEAGPASERAALYARGGVFVITSRILIVDLLQGTANAKDIEGMMVAHADKVVGDKCTEAFILRIFKSQRYFLDHSTAGGSDNAGGRGFVKAFTDDPSSLVSGSFAKVDKVLKSLQVQRLFLYPRFHAAVAEELERQPPTVIELHQPLSNTMKEIQNYLAASIRSCLRDLRQKCQLVDLSFLFDADGTSVDRKRKRDAADSFCSNDRARNSTEDWKFTIQKVMSTNFSYILSRQLEGDWHRLGRDVKQCVSDLRTLSQLFHYLIEYGELKSFGSNRRIATLADTQIDCVQFWRLLQGIKAMSAASKSQSYWMLQEAGECIFRLAKERVYRLITVTTANNQPVVKLKRILEHKPKEVILHQVLSEIENQWNRKREVARDKKYPVPSSANGNVLLMVKDERALRSVRTYLTHGNGVNRAAAQNFLSYLDQVQKQVKPMIRPGGLDLNSMSTEQRLLFEEHSRVYNILFGSDKMDQYNRIVEDDRRELTHWKTKQRKIVEEKARGAVVADTIHQQFYLDEAVKTSTREAKFPRIYSENESTEGSVGSSSSDDEDEVVFKVEPIEGLKLFIRTFSKVEEGEASILLHDIRPDYVVMYDSDPSFIRTLEIYSNSMKNPSVSSVELSKEDRLQVYFLLYEASAEDSNFLTSLERETGAFDRLIEHTKRMPTTLPAFGSFSTQEMLQSCGGVGGSYASGTLPLSMDTRTGGGKQKAAQERRDIAVDVREFRAALPSILHQGGMRLAPVTLTVGDFVLSNVHCVERKSISDLHGSFSNGRLKDQVKAMAKYYKCPCLLIEFDPEKNFALQTSSELGGEIRVDAITSKLAMLTMTFPMLRILWSRSPHETLKIFKKLKRNHQEVDVDKAVEIGNNESLDDLLVGGKEGYYNDGEEDYDDNDDAANDAAKSMLLRLPGMNAHNARKIMSECDSIASLARLSREELRRIAGPVAGQKLFTFFRDRLEV